MIGFNKIYFTGHEAEFVVEAIKSGHISGNGVFTKKCEEFFETHYGYHSCLLTNSCTAALEMAALLLDVGPGDEIILPSFTYVSTANAFVLRGATLKFVDVASTHPNIDVSNISKLITSKTKAIVVVHYGGIACDMDEVMNLAENHNLFVVEDAAQAISGSYKDRHLGAIGHLAALSFHETKNVQCGEGGMLIVNDERFRKRAMLIREKGTNRPDFFEKKVDKYSWVDVGSSYFPSDILAAILFGQLQYLDRIQERRIAIFEKYMELLQEVTEKTTVQLPDVPTYTKTNGHLFYLICASEGERSQLIRFLDEQDIKAVFHYQTLHDSPFFEKQYKGEELPNSKRYANRLLRLPLYYELEDRDVQHVCARIQQFYLK
jgi:dTDP-4-amino-4,6-dideoxygalactose transaminase